jgi:hypothetical protein
MILSLIGSEVTQSQGKEAGFVPCLDTSQHATLFVTLFFQGRLKVFIQGGSSAEDF